MVYNVEKSFEESKDKLEDSDRSEIESAISDSKEALKGTETEAMNNAFERLQTASHKLAEVLYAQQSGSPGTEEAEQASSASAGGDDTTTSSSDDDVIDAEYVDAEEVDSESEDKEENE